MPSGFLELLGDAFEPSRPITGVKVIAVRRDSIDLASINQDWPLPIVADRTNRPLCGPADPCGAEAADFALAGLLPAGTVAP